MPLHLIAEWDDQTKDEQTEQTAAFNTKFFHEGCLGLLKDDYGGEGMPIKYLAPEAFRVEGARIQAKLLCSRLPETLWLAEVRHWIREGHPLRNFPADLRGYRDFVKLCERMEKRSGKPVKLYAA